jgi:hypothetical protein
VPVTWNPADKSASVSLSGGNLVMSATAGGYHAARATAGKSSGKWYWEVTSGNSDGQWGVGIGSSGQTLDPNGGLSNLEGSRVYLGANGNKYTPEVGYGAATFLGLIGVKLDMDSGTLELLLNNVSMGVLVSGLVGTFYPYAFVNAAANPSSLTANFGASAFSYSLPPGYQAFGAEEPAHAAGVMMLL